LGDYVRNVYKIMHYLIKEVSSVLRVKRYKTVAIPIGLWNEVSHIVKATGIYSSEAEFVREAVRGKLGEFSIVEARSVPEGKVEEEIIRYIEERGKAYPSDITVDLGIPYFTVLKVIEKLVKEGKIKPAEE